jgi:hypothetical protein
MLKTLTFVRMQPGWSRDAFFKRWCEHTHEWDLRDHPEISLNRLMMLEGTEDYVGVAENHWPDQESLDAAIAWYATEAGQIHWRDLNTFMDTENCLTVTIVNEAVIDSSRGITPI